MVAAWVLKLHKQLNGRWRPSCWQTTGTYGMNYSLVSRDLIADCIETMYEAYSADALFTLSGCDKTIPGCLMPIARSNAVGTPRRHAATTWCYHGADVPLCCSPCVAHVSIHE